MLVDSVFLGQGELSINQKLIDSMKLDFEQGESDPNDPMGLESDKAKATRYASITRTVDIMKRIPKHLVGQNKEDKLKIEEITEQELQAGQVVIDLRLVVNDLAEQF